MTHKSDGESQRYIATVDSLILSLLKNEREPILESKRAVLSKGEFGLDQKVEAYDGIFIQIIDSLEAEGYLTRDFIIETFNADIPGIDD